jgi:hypothetical protein
MAACSQLDGDQTNSNQAITGQIRDKSLPESSGIAISRINPNTLWSHNDSGNSPELVAFSLQGKFRARVEVQGVENTDWEDLATFNYRGTQYLLIADTGDNYARRDEYRLHIIAEPELTDERQLKPIKITPSWTISYTYPNGARDSESVAVDSQNEMIVLLSKRDEPPQLFELPLRAGSAQVAKKIGEIPMLPEPADPEFKLIDLLGYSSQPTAMDISEDGQSIALLTYDSAFVFTKGETNDSNKKSENPWLSLLSSTPKRWVLPSFEQAEGIAFDPSGEKLYVTSEKLPAPILAIQLGN